MPFNLLNLWLILGLIWLIVLSLLLWKISVQLQVIFRNGKDKSLAAVIQRLIHDIEHEKKLSTLHDERIKKLELHTQTHIQKIGLIRFNPFNDTGGDQSFVLALLDANKTGIVISGLFARSTMRWYVKHIVEGKGQEHNLSEEEQKAVDIAK